MDFDEQDKGIIKTPLSFYVKRYFLTSFEPIYMAYCSIRSDWLLLSFSDCILIINETFGSTSFLSILPTDCMVVKLAFIC